MPSLSAAAHGQDAPRIAVWYRSANGCPDGDAFLSSLEARAVHARLAQVGDAIDFVVTLGSDQRGSSGVLERQTETGTVAIRRVDDASCEQVAQALSLTLALATQAPSNEPQPDPQPAVAIAQPTAALPEPAPQPIVVSPPVKPASPSPEHASTRASLGANVSFALGVAPDLLTGGGLFVELELGSGVLRPALRVGAVAAYGSGARGGEEISVRLLGARLEGCPIELAARSIALRPCVAVELGELHSEREGATGRSDGGLWLASEAALRLSMPLATAFSLEAELGLAIPWFRYTLAADTDPPSALHRTASVSGAARIGGVVHFP